MIIKTNLFKQNNCNPAFGSYYPDSKFKPICTFIRTVICDLDNMLIELERFFNFRYVSSYFYSPKILLDKNLVKGIKAVYELGRRIIGIDKKPVLVTRQEKTRKNLR